MDDIRDIVSSLGEPLQYFPLQAGAFEFTVGLRRLPPEAGDGIDGLIQIDKQWPRYRKEKLDARREQVDKYICSKDLSEPARYRATAVLIDYLLRTWPALFRWDDDGDITRLHCELSGETLFLDPSLELIRCKSATDNPPQPGYINALDALCCQIHEDLAICQRQDQSQDSGNHITYLHLCLPNHWAPGDKIGRDFIGIHGPVPGMTRINRHAATLIRMLTGTKSYERFAWGLTTDARLNHHPHAVNGPHGTEIGREQHTGRRFDSSDPKVYLRVERQVCHGLADVGAFLFLIRTYVYDIRTLERQQLIRLTHTLETMSAEIRAYKGVTDELIHCLTQSI